jgi:hypothetical protein
MATKDVFTVLIPTSGAPVFLDHQIGLLRRFSAEQLDIVVVNDARPYAHLSNWMDANAATSIDEVCGKHKVGVLRTPDRLLSRLWSRAPSERTADTLNFGFSRVRNNPFVAIIDSDMFPVAPFSFHALLGTADLAGIPQMRTAFGGALVARYFWNGFLLLRTSTLPKVKTINFGCSRFPRTDTGGKLSTYLRRHQDIAVKNLLHIPSGSWRDLSRASTLPKWLQDFISHDPCNIDGSFFSEVYAEAFFHFRSGGNWQSITGDKSQKYADRYQSFVACLNANGESRSPSRIDREPATEV